MPPAGRCRRSLTWALAWALFLLLRVARRAAGVAIALAAALGARAQRPRHDTLAALFIGAGFPLSLAASGLAGALPAWAWLLPLALLLLLYPLNAWRDAPLFPTPTGALQGLARAGAARRRRRACSMPAAASAPACRSCAASTRRPASPAWSGAGRCACCARCAAASRRCGAATSGPPTGRAYDLVYLFQRPESMARAAEKASRELRPGAWLASLEFEATDAQADGAPAARWRETGLALPRAVRDALNGRDDRLNALSQSGATLADVVRVHHILPNGDDFARCWPVLRRYFGDVRRAATMICAKLLDPRMLSEVVVERSDA